MKKNYIVLVGNSVKYEYAEKKNTLTGAKATQEKAESNMLQTDIIDLSESTFIDEIEQCECYRTEEGKYIAKKIVEDLLGKGE